MNDFLSQEEIDALLHQKEESGKEGEKEAQSEQEFETKELKIDGETTEKIDLIIEKEKDALGEIGNISMGSASTALSLLLNQKVTITVPKVRVDTQGKLFQSFEIPYVVIDVNFTEGLQGSNLLLIKLQDANIIADLMMGGDGSNPPEELGELQLSAVGEAMNQMIGSAATSMSTIFHRSISISPPTVSFIDFQEETMPMLFEEQENIVVISFKMKIGDLVDSEIMQVMSLEAAREQVGLLFSIPAAGEPDAEFQTPPEPENLPAEKEKSTESVIVPTNDRNIDLILDVPLRISVILGRTRRTIDDVLKLGPGALLELDKLIDEPVEILVNGKQIAQGEVVVIEENFGVRILNIGSPRDRINNLRF